MGNPHQSPSDKTVQTENQSLTQQTPVCELSDDCRGNLRLTSKIVKIASVASSLIALGYVVQIWFAYRFYAVANGWTGWRTWICLRIAYAPCLFLIAWTMWKYAASLDAMAEKGVAEAQAVIERQAKMWLAIGLLLFAIFVGIALFASYAVAHFANRQG